MATVAQRWDVWLDFVADLAARPTAEFPRHEIMAVLRRTFQTRVSWNHVNGTDFDFELDDPIRGWPTDDDYHFWRTEGFEKNPLLCFYGRTQRPTPMTVRRVPRQLVPWDGFALLDEQLRWVGLEEQLAIPYSLSAAGNVAFVLAQTGEDYSDEDLELARLVQPLIALVDRQTSLLAATDCATARSLGLTGRELAVLQLLAEGSTAVAIAHALRVSPRTVHTHLTHVYRKLGVCDRMRAVLVARELGIID